MPRSERLHIAITPEEKEEWESWAARRRQTLSEFIRQTVFDWIIRQEKEEGK